MKALKFDQGALRSEALEAFQEKGNIFKVSFSAVHVGLGNVKKEEFRGLF